MLKVLVHNLGRFTTLTETNALASLRSSERQLKWNVINVQHLLAVRSISLTRKGEVYNVDNNDGGGEEKQPRTKTLDFKQKIYLKDQFGRMLGLKTREEADQIAKKNKLMLIEDDTTKKIPTLRLMNPRKVILEGGVLPESIGGESDLDEATEQRTSKKDTHKQLIFGSKVSEHDLATKIRQAKRWVAKGSETVIRVQAPVADYARMRHIFNEFELQFNAKTGCKINQKRVTEKDLKFNIVPVDTTLMDVKDVQGDDQQFDAVDLDNIDPNQLLNDDTILVNKNKKK